MLPEMKRDAATAWLKEVDSIAIQTSLKNLKDAYDRFFKKH
jgi:putative transposase